jgi:hypothetical protein
VAASTPIPGSAQPSPRQERLKQWGTRSTTKTSDAKKARILINALVDFAKANARSIYPLKDMLCGVSLYLEKGNFIRENWRTWHRVSDAAKVFRDSGDYYWKRHVTFEHARPINVMYKMMLAEKATLTLERAAIIIGEYPPVLVTMEEDRVMAKLGFQHDGAPEQRYAHVPISGFSLRSDVPAARKNGKDS